MPEVKANVRSPRIVKYGTANLVRVDFDVYVYSGTKNTDKGSSVLSFTQYPQGTDEFVVVDWAEIANEYIKPNVTTPLNSNVDYVKWLQIDYVLVAPDTNKNFYFGGNNVVTETLDYESVECVKKYWVNNYQASGRQAFQFQFGNGQTLKIGDRVYYLNEPLENWTDSFGLPTFSRFLGYYYMYDLVVGSADDTTTSSTQGFFVKIEQVSSGEIQVTDIRSLTQVDETVCTLSV